MKRKVILILSLAVFLMSTVMLFQNSSRDGFNKPSSITGNANAGTVSLTVETEVNFTIHILSPENTTYNFSPGSNYTLDLEVYASESLDSWWFSLEDLRHESTVWSSVPFTPNATFNAVRWSNQLTVYANDSTGAVGSASVTFYIEVPNTSPELGDFDNPLFVCEEGDFISKITVTDPDEDHLTFSINPGTYFFIWPTDFYRSTYVSTDFFASDSSKVAIGSHNRNISVTDQFASDTSAVNISVIEINHPPNVSSIGVQTVWNNGENTFFNRFIPIDDIEDGNVSLAPNNFTLNISFNNSAPLFNISDRGHIEFDALDRAVGVYNFSICAIDRGLYAIHPNISLCGQTGLNMSNCSDFSLTITDENRPPRIDDYAPSNLTFNAAGEQTIYFSIVKSDPDGTIPDSYWYVDGRLMNYFSGQVNDSFSYAFPCGVSGVYGVNATITDGLLNASVHWNVTVSMKNCSVEVSAGGGGGGGGGGARVEYGCIERWFCSVWSVCQNLEESYLSNLIPLNDYQPFKKGCLEQRLNDFSCGFQFRKCYDLSDCDTSYDRPEEDRYCQYVENPNCLDGVKNCHDGACEVLIDCGGPCETCPSCSDGIKNQGEAGIDCGGPCPTRCTPEKMTISKWIMDNLIYFLLAILLLLLIIVLYKMIHLILTIRRVYWLEEFKWYKVFLGGLNKRQKRERFDDEE